MLLYDVGNKQPRMVTVLPVSAPLRAIAPAAAAALSLTVAAQPTLGPPRGGEAPVEVRGREASRPPACARTDATVQPLSAELGAQVAAATKAAAQQYVATPGPGVTTEKAWGDFAAAALLAGDLATAGWAGLAAAASRGSGEHIANAGIYLQALGKSDDALAWLNCAVASGYRSPYLFEALALAHRALGNVAGAREAITAAAQLEPDDGIIEAEASFINTGGPPPARSPAPPPDALDAAIAELEAHAARTLAILERQTDVLAASFPDDGARGMYDASAAYVSGLAPLLRQQAREARASDAQQRPFRVNAVYGIVISSYAQITDALLSFPDSTETSGSNLLVWADALGLDPTVLARESGGSAASLSLAKGALDDYERGVDAARMQYDERDCPGTDNACRVRVRARFCAEWQSQYEDWANASRARYNTAARRFDQVATDAGITAENELLLMRDFAVRQAAAMPFPATPGVDMRRMTLEGIDMSLRFVFDRHTSAEQTGIAGYLDGNAQWFASERDQMEQHLGSEGATIESECAAAFEALLELLLDEQWQAYREHLRDRLAWDLQGQVGASEFPCEGTVGPLTISTDLEKRGEGRLDLNWSPKDSPFGGRTTVALGPDQTVGLSVGAKVSGGPFSATYDSGFGVGGKVGYGPFQGKGKVTLTSKTSPWNSREYSGLRLKGSAGLGLKSGALGAACYPSSGSVTFYPRAFAEDAMRYLSTPSTRPN